MQLIPADAKFELHINSNQVWLKVFMDGQPIFSLVMNQDQAHFLGMHLKEAAEAAKKMEFERKFN